MSTPTRTLHNQLFKSLMNLASKFCLIHQILRTVLSPTDYHFLQASQKLFAGKMLPWPVRGRKCFSGVCQIMYFVVVQSLSCVQLFAIPWPAAHQTSLSFTISWSLLKLRSIESVMPSNHLILCHILFLLPPIFPSIRVFSSESAVASGGRSMGASTSASVLPMNIPIL